MPKTKSRRNAATRTDLASRASSAQYRAKHRDLTTQPCTTNRDTRIPLTDQTPVDPYGWTGTRRHGNKRGPSTKGQGEWRTVSPSYRTASTVDARWAEPNPVLNRR